jgi:hypothetical protein
MNTSKRIANSQVSFGILVDVLLAVARVVHTMASSDLTVVMQPYCINYRISQKGTNERELKGKS